MKQKWTIALVAILTFALILSGCAVLPQSAGVNTDDLRPYGGNDIHTEDDAYDYGARGRAANSGPSRYCNTTISTGAPMASGCSAGATRRQAMRRPSSRSTMPHA